MLAYLTRRLIESLVVLLLMSALVYLLIGPAWVLAKLYRRLGLRW